jgi:hypothetical protein
MAATNDATNKWWLEHGGRNKTAEQQPSRRDFLKTVGWLTVAESVAAGDAFARREENKELISPSLTQIDMAFGDAISRAKQVLGTFERPRRFHPKRPDHRSFFLLRRRPAQLFCARVQSTMISRFPAKGSGL